MKSLTEYIQLLAACAQYLAASNGFKFMLATVFGLALGALGYWLSSLSSRLWNRSFHLRGKHHIVFTLAAFITLIFSVVYFAVDFMEPVARREIQGWRVALMDDVDWRRDVFIRAYDALSKSKLEDLSGVGNPRIDPNVILPLRRWETKMLVAKTYSQGALQNFEQRHPFLDSALQPGEQAPEEGIKEDLLNFFKNEANAKTYPAERAIILASSYLESQARSELPNIENYTRRITLALFILVQLIVFAVISIAAYRSLTATV